MAKLSLTSSAFGSNQTIPAKYTSDGENISPPLSIQGVSSEAKSLVLIVDDPDAATDPLGPGKTFDHWIVFNISPSTGEIAENTTPIGATTGKNGVGDSHYIGPAPPTGTHRYYFRLYELNLGLDLSEAATKDQVLSALKPYLLDQTELIGTYKKQS